MADAAASNGEAAAAADTPPPSLASGAESASTATPPPPPTSDSEQAPSSVTTPEGTPTRHSKSSKRSKHTTSSSKSTSSSGGALSSSTSSTSSLASSTDGGSASAGDDGGGSSLAPALSNGGSRSETPSRSKGSQRRRTDTDNVLPMLLHADGSEPDPTAASSSSPSPRKSTLKASSSSSGDVDSRSATPSRRKAHRDDGQGHSDSEGGSPSSTPSRRRTHKSQTSSLVRESHRHRSGSEQPSSSSSTSSASRRRVASSSEAGASEATLDSDQLESTEADDGSFAPDEYNLLYNTRTTVASRHISETDLLQFVVVLRLSVLATYRLVFEITPEIYDEVIAENISVALSPQARMTAFAPKAFEIIRRIKRIDVDTLLWSWSQPDLAKVVSPGKSGSMIVVSHQSRFLIKTISEQEAKWLRALLPAYIEHLHANPASLLVPILGLYLLTDGKKKTYFITMPGVYNTEEPIAELYDIKGSTADRSSKKDKKEKDKDKDKDKEKVESVLMEPLKDCDVKRTFGIGSTRERFLEQLEKDCEFLEQHKLMDYSMLIATRAGRTTTTSTTTTTTTSTSNPSLVAPTVAPASSSSLRISEMCRKAPRFLFFVEPQRDSKYKVYSPPPAVVHEPSYAPVSPLRPAMKHNRQHQRRFGLAPPNPAVVSQLLETSQAEGRTLSVPILPPNLLAMLPEPLQPLALPPWCEQLSPLEPAGAQNGAGDGELFFFGIVDYLQKYNTTKRLAHFTKSVRGDSKRLSTVDPTTYSQRFRTALASHIA